MRVTQSKIYFIILTGLIIGGMPGAVIQEAQAQVNSVVIDNIADNNRVSADFTIQTTIGDAGGNTASAGTITFTRTSGTADANSPHTYNMAAGEYGTSAQFTKTRAQLETGFGNTLVSGTTYTVVSSVTDTVTTTDTQTGVVYDTTRPTMSSAVTTSTTTIDVTFSEDILDAEAADFTLSDGLTVASVTETGGVVTITTNEEMSEDATPTITLGNDFVTDVINVGTVNTAVGASIVVTDGLANAKNSSGCSDCEAPTLGLNSDFKRIVENGFTYNGKPADAERFFTPYPLITATVGKQNTAVFKIYEDRGPEYVKHFSFAFGLDKGQSIGESQAMIELDIDHEGTETVTVTDPENALDNIKVSTNIANCNDNNSQIQCLIVTIDHRFRAPLDFNIVGTDVWDMKRNAWQNYFNHGIEITGESLNPANEYDGVSTGHIYHLTETGKTTAIDEFGDTWSFQYGKWIKDYVQNERIQDTTSVFNRNHSDFVDYKEQQAQNAIPQLLQYCPSCLTSHEDFKDSFGYEYPETIDKLDNPEILQKMILENEKAQVIMDYLLDPVSYRR